MLPLRAITQRLCYSMWLFYLHSAVKIQPFSPVFPLVGSAAKASFRLSLWNFKEKTSISFYNTAILLVTPLEFRESASHFLMARPSKNSRKADDPAAGHNAKALLLYVVVSSPQSGGKYSLFLRFSPWRNPRLRHFSGYPFGTSRKKTSIFFYNTAILLVTPLEFRKSAGHFLMARPSKTSGKRMLPLRAITQKSRSRGRGIYVPDVVSGTTAPEEAVPVHTISRLLSTPCRE